eukprot:UN16721
MPYTVTLPKTWCYIGHLYFTCARLLLGVFLTLKRTGVTIFGEYFLQ